MGHKALLTVFFCVGLVAMAIASPPVPVAEFDFEAPGGGPDAQGWRPLMVGQDKPSHFHVQDFSGAGQQAVALAGNQSLWCGQTLEDPDSCHWEGAPGYGASWNENFVSQEFAITGDATIGFLMAAGLEPSYDFVFLEFEAPDGHWVRLDAWDCGSFSPCAPLVRQYDVLEAEHDGNLRFRFHLMSDGAGDNETPYGGFSQVAFVVDSLVVSDATGVVNYQDFEAEAVADTVTADNVWHGEPNRDGYSAGFLVDGNNTVQETAPANDSWFWSFYLDSTLDYGCAGYPQQPVVPETRSMIRSPRIALTTDINGDPIAGVADSVRFSFDVYRDILPTEHKYYRVAIRSYVDNCLLNREWSAVFRSGEKDWFRQQFTVGVPVATTEIEIDVRVENSNVGESECRSHAPLFDNFLVERLGGGVSAVDDQVVPDPVLVISNTPNPFNPATTIRFELPVPGVASLRVYDIAGRLVRTLLAESETPAGAGRLVWRGVDDQGRAVASGTYFVRLMVGARREIHSVALVR